MKHTNDASILRQQLKRKRKQVFQVNEKDTSKVKGDSGLHQFQLNDVTAEFDPQLMGRLGSKNFSEMSKSDGTVGGLLAAYKNLILSCNWTLAEIPDITPEEQKVSDVLHDWFFTTNNFEPFLTAALRMLESGFTCFNKFYTKYDRENSFYMMPVLLERVQKSIYRIDYERNLIEQITTQRSTTEISFEDLVFFTFRQEGNDLRGVSLLRQAYYDYIDKKEVKGIAKKGIVREMLGMPVGKVPPNVKSDTPEYEMFASLLDTVSSRAFADTDDAIILPNNYELELLRGDFKITDIKEHLGYYDSQILLSVLAQFLLLGQQGKGGSFSLGSDQSDFFLDGLQFIINYIQGQFNKYVLQPTVKANFENVDVEKFKLVGLNLNKKASAEFANILSTLISSGVVVVQDSDQKLIREMYGLPEMEEQDETNPNDSTSNDEEEIEPTDDNDDETVDDVEEDQDEVSENSKVLSNVEVQEFWNTGKQRDVYLEREVKNLTKFSKASLQLIGDKLLASMRWHMKKNTPDTKGLNTIKLNQNAVASYKKAMRQKLSAIVLKSWDNAVEKSKPHLEKLAVDPKDLPTKVLTAFVTNHSDIALEKQLADFKDTTLLVANTASTKGYGIEQTIAESEANIDKFIDNGNQAELTNSVGVSQAMSYGEMQYYKEIDDDLWGYRFENVSPKTNICQNLTGKVYRKNRASMEQMSPPLHFRCKSYYEPIYKDLEKPEYDDYIPPASIMKEKTM